jgi:uncharacterized protein (DUF2267 family)
MSGTLRRLENNEEAEKAIRATLQTLKERLAGDVLTSGGRKAGAC